MVERSLSMREVMGSIPISSKSNFFLLSKHCIVDSFFNFCCISCKVSGADENFTNLNYKNI